LKSQPSIDYYIDLHEYLVRLITLEHPQMVFDAKECYGGKNPGRITVMACANMNDTEKFPLMTIGKFQNPRCYKRVSLPVHMLPV